ncbi:SusC/RagA family TonB-linked outer membrane protein [Pseudochryseolinea flava]|uniref:SusC/RagA family TonB-linked outer membrane protein n=1 Tax=Pseudochryseolinea flava TaxID=2059302 RepID=A0A364Y3L7_9BACT|nr:SusC/RagA family TonB-linked outer membrane protein [Pseudochryseolinea flava]RAW00609.1 SusC/RagA family TonB-linked outer membrane protein [Pseudochryseolinea flava]
MTLNFTNLKKTVLLFVLLTCWLFQAQAQRMSVSGKVKSQEDDQPLPGVSIVIKGTATGTVTDAEGNYTIQAQKGETIVFSFLGMKSEEVVVADQTTIDLSLTADITNLGEVVVTALGIKREKKALGYAVTEVSGSQLSTAIEVNAVNSLSGKVAGVDISTPTAGPSGSTRVVIRGNASLSGKNQPLYVIDGVPMDNGDMGSDAGMWGGYDLGNGISSLNPNDIESVSVLKGASASALYGSRASDGVILITTKSGKVKKGIGVEVTSNYTAERVLSRFDDYQTTYGMGRQGVLPTSIENAQTTQVAWGAKLNPNVMVPIYNGEMKPYGAVNNNILSFFRTGSTATNTISLSGGTEKATIRMSVSDLRNQDIVPGTGLRRNTFLINSSLTLADKITISGKVNYINEKVDNRPALSDNPNNVGLALLGIAPNFDQRWLSQNYKDAQGNYVDWNGGNIYRINPYWSVNEIENTSTRNRIIGYLQLNYAFSKSLSFQARGGTDFYSFRYTNFSPKGTPTVTSGAVEELSVNVFENNFEGLLKFNKQILPEFSITAYGGGNIMRSGRENSTSNGQEIILPDIHPITNFRRQTNIYQLYKKQINSLYGATQFAYKDTYFVDATFRNDWSSSLRPGLNSYFYTSLSGSYVFSNHLENQRFLSFGKIRGSVAQVGGDAAPYQLSLNYGLLEFSHLGKPMGQVFNTDIPNADLKPTKTYSYEIGTDLQFLEGRVRLDVAYYNARTVNQILSLKIPVTSGYNNAVINAGQIRNKGIELSLSATPINNTTSGFSWDVMLNYTKNINEVERLHEQIKTYELSAARWAGAVIQAREGAAYGVIVGRKFKRDPEGNIIHNAAGFPMPTDATDQAVLGNGVHKWMMGLSNTFKYKGISLSALIDLKVGADIYSMSNALAYQNGTAEETVEGRDAWYASEEARLAAGVSQEAWTPTGGYVGKGVVNVGTAEKPEYVANAKPVDPELYWRGFLENSPEYFIYDASYAKLRELTIGYTLPPSIISKTPFESISVSFVARNLFILYSNIPNVDPESGYNNGNGQGFEYGSLPSRRSFGASVNLKF